MKGILQKIALILISLILLLSYFAYLCSKNNITMFINIFAVILFSLVIIPYIFFDILKTKLSRFIKYHSPHIIYILLPASLLGQLELFNRPLIIFVTLIISTCNLFILYKYCKEMIKSNIKYLRYSNMLISGIFTLLITFISLYRDNLENIFILIFLLPLVNLQILYEKIDLDVKDIEN